MSLTLHYHPLSSFCQKVLIALYEVGVPFDKNLVDLSSERERAALVELWGIGKFPVLCDDDRVVPESSIIIEYLEQYHRGRGRLVPEDPDRARECRLRDRFFDSYVNAPMSKVVTDKLRPPGQHDTFGVERALAELGTAYDLLEAEFCGGDWALGDEFSMADCAAAPALLYAQQVLPFGTARTRLNAYYRRLTERPSFARVLQEVKPYWAMFPGAS